MQPSNDITFTTYGLNFNGVVHSLLMLFLGNPITVDSIMNIMSSAWTIFATVSFIVSGFLIFGIIYSFLKIAEYNEISAHNLAAQQEAWRLLHGGTQENRRWSEIKAHVSSGTPNDWKLAIIEADIMLGEVLRTAGYAGTTIGDQLKSAGTANFATLDDAWEAHRIRNRIAHEGADFVLTQGAAKAAIIKYERVFREFGLV